MPKLRSLALIAALAVLTVSAECIARCATADCHAGGAAVPPCHRHRAPAQPSNQVCSHWLVLDARTAPQQVSWNAAPAAVAATLAEAPVFDYTAPAVPHPWSSSPAGRLFTSLRI